MNVIDIKTQMHMEEWAKLMEARQDSGLSIKQWCRQNNMSEIQYYYLRKLRLAAWETLSSERWGGMQFALIPNHAHASNPVITGSSNIKIIIPNAVVYRLPMLYFLS